MRMLWKRPGEKDPYLSVKIKLFSINLGALFAVWAFLLVLVYGLMDRELYHILDNQLRSGALHIIQQYTRSPALYSGAIGLGDQQVLFSLWTVTSHGSQWTAEFVQGNPFVNAQQLYSTALKYPAGQVSTVRSDGVPYRAFLAVIPMANNTYMIRVIRPIGPTQAMLSRLLWTLGISGLVALGLVVALGIWLTSRSVSPMIASWRRQQQFVADASHELRTPLTIIRANLDILLHHPDHTIGSELQHLGNAYEEVTQTAELIENLLTLARADSHEQLIERKPVNLAILIQNLVETMQPMADAQEKTIRVTLPSAACVVPGDLARLRQLFLILLDNAFSYTHADAIITVAVECDTLRATVRVSDTGIGIPAELLPQIFERFVRGDASRHRPSGGTGLGLSIAKWIVEAHGGDITAASTPGKGSVFTVSLPN